MKLGMDVRNQFTYFHSHMCILVPVKVLGIM